MFHSSGLLLFHATESHIEIRVADSPDIGFVFVCRECVWLVNKETTWAFHRQNREWQEFQAEIEGESKRSQRETM